MEALQTIPDALQAGCTHVEIVCRRCNRARVCLLDLLARRGIHSLEDAKNAFICKRCHNRPNDIFFLNPEVGMTFFEYAVEIWNENRTNVEKVAFAAQWLDEAEPAYESVVKRYPRKWITLKSRMALLRDSDRREFDFDG